MDKNKIDEKESVTRNKARLVAQGYSQVERVNFDETFAHVARLEVIHHLLTISCVVSLNCIRWLLKVPF